MNVVVISIGDELVSGRTVDTNSAWLSQQLTGRGLVPIEHLSVGDDRKAIADAIRRAAELAQLVIVSGGLGPTDDDLTRQALADAMGSELELDQQCLAQIEAMFSRRGWPMAQSNRVQAMVPRGAQPLDNPVGTAPGLTAKVGQTRVFVVPGVPVEMRDMFKRQIVPRLPAGHGSIVHHIVHTFGAGESTVGMKIAPWMRRGANPTVGTTVADGLVSVRVVARGDSHDAADALACKTVAEIRDCLGELVVAEEEATMAHAVGSLLASFGQTVATAESCTGGLIGSMLTDVPGSSGYYRGGVVAYDNDVKVTMLDVPRDLLIDHGAVSEPVAAAMAQGARIRLAADWAVSVTGIAGPGGGTDEKPVGLVYMGLAGPNGATNVASRQFSGPRGVVRLRAALAALNELRLALLRRR